MNLDGIIGIIVGIICIPLVIVAVYFTAGSEYCFPIIIGAIVALLAVYAEQKKEAKWREVRQEREMQREKQETIYVHRTSLNRHRPQSIQKLLNTNDPEKISGAHISDFEDLVCRICNCTCIFVGKDKVSVHDILESVKPHLWGSYIDISENELTRLIEACLDYFSTHEDFVMYGTDKSEFTVQFVGNLGKVTEGSWRKYVENAIDSISTRKDEWIIEENLPCQIFYEEWFGDMSDEMDVMYQEEIAKGSSKGKEKPKGTTSVDVIQNLLTKARRISDEDVQENIKKVGLKLSVYKSLDNPPQTSANKSLFSKYLPMYIDAIDDFIRLDSSTTDKAALADVKQKLMKNSELLANVIQDIIDSANENDEMLLSADLSVLESLLKSETNSLSTMGGHNDIV